MKKLEYLPEKEPIKVSHNVVRNALNMIVKNTDTDRENVHIHALRHSHCSYLLDEGVGIHYISKRLGHASTTITLDVYSHLLEKKEKEEDSKVENNLERIWNN